MPNTAPGAAWHKQQQLATLNAYRERMNLKPLKAWKESRAKLDAAVAAIPPHTIEPTTAADIEDASRKLEAANDADAAPKTEAKKKPPKPPKADTTGTRTIPELCRAVGKKEKVGRAKCRRHGAKLRPLMIDPQPLGADQDWRFSNDKIAEVCAILGWDVPQEWKMKDSVPTSGN